MDTIIELEEELCTELNYAIQSKFSLRKGDFNGFSFFLNPPEEILTIVMGTPNALKKIIVPHVKTKLRKPIDFSVPANYFANAFKKNPSRSMWLKIMNDQQTATIDIMLTPSLLKHLLQPAIPHHKKALTQEQTYSYEEVGKSPLQLLIHNILEHNPEGLVEYVPEKHQLKIQHEDVIKVVDVPKEIRWSKPLIVDSNTLNNLSDFLKDVLENNIQFTMLYDTVAFQADNRSIQFSLPDRKKFEEMPVSQFTQDISFSCSLSEFYQEIKGLAQALPDSPQTYLFFDNGQVIIAPEAPDDKWAYFLNTLTVSSKKKAAFFFSAKDFIKKMPKFNVDVTIEIVRNDEGDHTMMLYTPKHHGATDCILPVFKDEQMIPELLKRKQELKAKEQENRQLERICQKRDKNAQMRLEL